MIRTTLRLVFMLIAAVAAINVSFASATTWHEITDGGGEAGELVATAQPTVGVGSLSTITGTDGGEAADLFAITIPNPAAFSATLSGTFTKQLWLFDLASNGVVHSESNAPSFTGSLVPSPGIYLIGASRAPYEPESPTGPMWLTGPTAAEHGPNGAGAPGPLTNWTNVTHNAFDFYQITLTGAEYAPSFTPVPEPSSLLMVLLAAGLLPLVRSRAR